MFNDELFSVLSNEELEGYLKDIAGDDAEYAQNLIMNEKINKIKDIGKQMSLFMKKYDKLLLEYKEFKGLGADVYLHDMLIETKHIWKNLKDLYDETVIKEHNEVLFDENNIIMKSDDILIKKGYNGYHIILPILLPHKKSLFLSLEYLNSYRNPIYNAFLRYFGNKRDFINSKACILIVHNFAKGQKFIDYDNFDYSCLINCISGFFIRDDDPDFFSLHLYGKATTKEHSFTEVYIGENAKFDNIRLQYGIV